MNCPIVLQRLRTWTAELHQKPIIFLNIAGFWQPFFDMITASQTAQFTPPNFDFTYSRVDTAEQVLSAIAGMKTQDLQIDTRKVV